MRLRQPAGFAASCSESGQRIEQEEIEKIGSWPKVTRSSIWGRASYGTEETYCSVRRENYACKAAPILFLGGRVSASCGTILIRTSRARAGMVLAAAVPNVACRLRFALRRVE